MITIKMVTKKRPELYRNVDIPTRAEALEWLKQFPKDLSTVLSVIAFKNDTKITIFEDGVEITKEDLEETL